MTLDPEAYKKWTPAAQERALQAVRERTNRTWRPFYCPIAACDGRPHGEWDWPHARADQRPPTDRQWLTWLNQSGRGTGKTRLGTEYTHRAARKLPRIGIVAGTSTDAREVLLEGESGLLTIAKPDFRPVYEPSKKRLTWPNGSVGTLFSAEEPDRLRGPEHYFMWLDEAAHWPLIQQCWDNLMFGLRLGQRPRILVTTTPKVRQWVKDLIADETTRVTTVSTYANLENLSPVFADRIIGRYEGTRLGRQELYGELLADIEGALWTWDMIETHRRPEIERSDLGRVVVSIDPAGSTRRGADETGIVVAGADDDHSYVLEDGSGVYTPHGWATRANVLYEKWDADAIVCETNFGGDMVQETLRNNGFDGRVINMRSTRGKELRAEPVVGLYEQGKVHHVFDPDSPTGSPNPLEDLEAQMTEWVPHETKGSPDRVDALVFCITELQKRRGKASISSPSHLRAVS